MLFNKQNLPNGYYVYAYVRKSNQIPYYIGKGCGNRAWIKHNGIGVPCNDYIRILESNLTELGAFALERRYIRWYGRKDIQTGVLRNKTDGGEGVSGWSPSVDHRKRISDCHTGKKVSDRTRLKMSKAQIGKTCSEETRRKLSDLKTGTTLSEDARLKLSNSLKGRKVSDNVRAKISATQKGRVSPLKGRKVGPKGPLSEEHRKAISQSLIGRIVSEDTREKYSKIHKGKIVKEETKLKLSLANKGKPWSDARRQAQLNKKKTVNTTPPPGWTP